MSFKAILATVILALANPQVANSAITKRVTCPTGQTTANEKCCALFPIIDKLQSELFDGSQCGEEAHSALRLSFHDAIGFSVNGGKGGGADGSILQFASVETAYHANGGIDDITNDQFPIFQEVGNLTAGDFVHLAAAVGITNCPGAPSLNFFLGRAPPVSPAPDLTVPEPTDSVTSILDRFSDAGFSPPEVIALLASHTIAAADVVDPTITGTPFDSTVGTFDSQVFLEVLLKGTLFPGNGSQPGEVLSPIAGEMRLQSDFALSRDSRTACLWQNMVDNQNFMVTSFKNAMTKLQLLGQDQSTLTDCSDVIPAAPAFSGSIKFPPSFSQADLEIACTQSPFPTIATQAGPAPTLPPVPGS